MASSPPRPAGAGRRESASSSSSRPSLFGATQLSTRRLRSNSGGVLAQDLGDDLSAAERNSVAPPAPVYKIVLTGVSLRPSEALRCVDFVRTRPISIRLTDAFLPPDVIVIFQGPCGGKTTALARLSPYLRERGFEVIACPEAFSILVSNGMSFDYLGAVEGMDVVVQDTVMDMQIGLEDGFERVLRARGKPAVLLCDRGLMDGSAYMAQEGWDRLLAKRDVKSVSELREGRYNAVFHLVTAAEGAEQFYTLENNAVRTETPELARELDQMTRNAWVGHPNLKIFDNSTGFEEKLQRVVEETARLVGLPTQMQKVTTKFLLREAPNLEAFPEDVRFRVFDVEKVYLNQDHIETENVVEEYTFIRKRSTVNEDGEASGSVYGWTGVQITRDGQTIEKKRIITKREYNSLFNNRDKSRHIVRQKRISFLHNIQSFTIHIYQQPVSDICLLHAQVQSTSESAAPGQEVSIPPFLEVEKLLTDSEEDARRYGAYHISLKN